MRELAENAEAGRLFQRMQENSKKRLEMGRRGAERNLRRVRVTKTIKAMVSYSRWKPN